MLFTNYGKEVDMQIYIYSTEEITKDNLDFLNFNQLIYFDEVDKIKNHFSEEWLPILLIWSQPSDEIVKELEQLKWYKRLVRMGIRYKTQDSLYLENTNKYEIFKQLSIQYKRDINQTYLKLIKELILDESDYQYLSTYYEGMEIKDFNMKVNKRQNSQFTGMIALVGQQRISKKMIQEMTSRVSGRTLLIDGNLLAPSLDEIYGIHQMETGIRSHLTGIDNTGINVALDTILKGIDIKSSIDQLVKRVSPKLDLMLGNYNIYNYEHYDVGTIKRLLLNLQQLYECVVVVVSGFPYDEMTMLTLHMSSVNIFTTSGSLAETRHLFQFINLLEAKQGIVKSKNKILLKKTNKLIDLKSRSVLKFLFKDNFYSSAETIVRKGIGIIN